MRKIVLLALMAVFASAEAVDLTRCKIVSTPKDAALVRKIAGVLAEDVERVSGVRPELSDRVVKGDMVVIATVDHVKDLGIKADVSELRGAWERYKIVTKGQQLIIVGSDARGAAYGALHVSERIGVSPWYWWADVKASHNASSKASPDPSKGGGEWAVANYSENFTSKSPTVKFRGFFINDEDWGLKTWSARNFEKELKDIGPKTYDKVCELILRLKGNMLAPAMHSCTGAFYTHPQSQVAADSWGILITTSHCEPMLVNNASKQEWDKDVDGEWNYLTNRDNIWKKFDSRLRETAQYENIYTTGLRGLHDAAMNAPKDLKVRAQILEQVFADQRDILVNHKKRPITTIPQIFVPYKEALDIYDSGLRVPDDITLVWPDDNYGYMKRVSNAEERKRSGGCGVYYHISYLGAPHDNLWIATTAPVLMYEELKKAYDAGGDRYWLLNVGDIKPMEIEMQQFFDMAWDLSAFNYDNVNSYQAEFLAHLFGGHDYQLSMVNYQFILDHYYRLAWQRKPEFMGYEMEWDTPENNRMHDSDFSPAELQQRLADYRRIAAMVDSIEQSLPADLRPAFFEMLGFSVKGAYEMNRKFLMAQLNHETGSAEAAREAQEAFNNIQALMDRYNKQLDGKWNQMMSQLPPGFRAKYQLMPELVTAPTDTFRLPADQLHPRLAHKVDLKKVKTTAPFRLVEGIGTDWISLQMGDPLDAVQDPSSLSSDKVEIAIDNDSSSFIKVCISVVPFWPVSTDRSNRFGVSLDGCEPIVCENRFTERSYPWKLQVLENRKEFVMTFPIDRSKSRHTLSLIMGDPGQMVQQITYE